MNTSAKHFVLAAGP